MIKYVIDDTFVDQDRPDDIYGAERYLSCGCGNYVYLRFDIRDIDLFTLHEVEKVTVGIAVGFNNTSQKPYGFASIYPMATWEDSFWQEETMTYNTRVKAGNVPLYEIYDITFDLDRNLYFNVTNDFLRCVRMSYDYYSVMIYCTITNMNWPGYFYSKELNLDYPEYNNAATPALAIKYQPK